MEQINGILFVPLICSIVPSQTGRPWHIHIRADPQDKTSYQQGNNSHESFCLEQS